MQAGGREGLVCAQLKPGNLSHSIYHQALKNLYFKNNQQPTTAWSVSWAKSIPLGTKLQHL